jgi:hypothetical protein
MIIKSQKIPFLIYLMTTGLMMLLSILSYGQGKNEEVTIIAPYIPTISDATKIPFRPEITQGEHETPSFDYNYITKKYDTRMELNPVEPLKYSEGKQDEVYRNYANIGFGNYVTPYIEFMASSLRSEKYQFGVRLKHHSSQGMIKDYPPSAYSHDLVSVFGKSFSTNHTLAAEVGYKRDVVHFYGFPPDSFPDVAYSKEDIRQRFQLVEGSLKYSSNYREKYMLNHLLGFGFNVFSDLYGTTESQLSFQAGIDKAFKTGKDDFNHSFALDIGVDFLGYRDSISSSHPVFVMFKPVYRFSLAQYRFEAGLSINSASRSSENQSTGGFNVFPILKAAVVIVDQKLEAFAEVSGNRTINSFRGLAGINPFIISTPQVYYTDEQIKIGGGITGNAGRLNFQADAFYSYLVDMPLFVTDTSLALPNKFEVIYDNMNLLKLRASLGYVRVNQFSARLNAAYYHYIPKNEVKAWQMPNYEVGLNAGYTFLEKYTVRTSMLVLGSKYARVFKEGEIIPAKIAGAFDLGFGVSYQVNQIISAYVDGSNLLNQHYQRWFNYPVQGIQVMAGVKLTF